MAASVPESTFSKAEIWQQSVLLTHMPEHNDNSKAIRLERVDLDFRTKPELAERLERFLSEHKSELELEDEHDLITAWLDRVWPEGAPGEAIITKLAPKEGKQNWQLRPAWSDTKTADGKPVAAGSQIPAFGVFYRDGKLVVLWFEPVLHRPLGAYDFRLQGCFSRSSFRGGVTAEDAQRLLALPHYAPSAESRFAQWRTYLDWREKVTVDNSQHRYAYAEWEYWKDKAGVSFYLRERQPVELLKIRLQGQQLLALCEGEEFDPLKVNGDETGAQRRAKVAAAGSYQKVTPLEGGERRQKGSGRWQIRRQTSDSDAPAPHAEKLAVEVRLPEERRRNQDSDSETEVFPDAGELMVDVSGDLASIRSQRDAIERLEQGRAVNPGVAEWIFNSQKARVPESAAPVESTDTRLNQGQQRAVTKALAAPDTFFLQGPPGTGKTTVIAELCRQMVRQGKQTLITSQANLAVDNALGSLYPKDRPSPELRPLRELDSRRELDMEDAYKIFLPSRIVPHWLKQVAAACEATLQQAANQGDKWTAIKRAWVDRLRKGNAADNGEEMRKLYKRHANVIGATCNRTGRRDFYQSTEFDPSFEMVVVDEVSKATPPELLMPLLLGRRAVLVGDHRQLPPVFRSESFEEAVANEELKTEMLENFGKMVSASLFEELFISAPDALRETLREQYRMHPHIMHTVNHFYPDKQGKGILLAGGGEQELHKKKQHGLSVRGASERPLLTSEHRVLWLDSTRDERGQTVAEGAKRGTSRWNLFEIELIEDFLRHVDESLNSNPGAKAAKLDVGVISFYLAQTNELRERVGSKVGNRWQHLDVQVNTVDQFQGRECSVIIVSLVRTGEVSGEFVKDYRRINVAFSRAKNLLVIVGSRNAFEAAAVPICPVEGGEANAKKVYQEIAKTVAQRDGIRTASHIFKRTPQKQPVHVPQTKQAQRSERPRRQGRGPVDDMGLKFD